MLVSITLQNFGSVKEKQTLSLELSPDDVIDDNYVINAGNMRLLKMLFIVSKHLKGRSIFIEVLYYVYQMIIEPTLKSFEKIKYFQSSDTTNYQNTYIGIVFFYDNTKYSYEIELDDKNILREELCTFDENPNIIFKKTTNVVDKTTNLSFAENIKIKKEHKQLFNSLNLSNNLVLGIYALSNLKIEDLEKPLKWFEDYALTIFLPKIYLFDFVSEQIYNKTIPKPLIIQMFNKINIPITQIFIKIDKFKNNMFDMYKNFLYYSNFEQDQLNDNNELNELDKQFYEVSFEFVFGGDKYKVKYNNLPENIQSFFNLACLTLLSTYKDIFISIDNVDAEMNAYTFYYFVFFYLANVHKSQFVTTINNIDLLLNNKIIAPQAIYVIKKDEKFYKHLYRLSDLINSQTDTNFDIYKFLDIPKFDSAPDIKDFRLDFSAKTSRPKKQKNK